MEWRLHLNEFQQRQIQQPQQVQAMLQHCTSSCPNSARAMPHHKGKLPYSNPKTLLQNIDTRLACEPQLPGAHAELYTRQRAAPPPQH